MTYEELTKNIEKAKMDDEYAFNKIIKYLKDDLFRIAKSRLLNDEDAIDAVQETIFTIYKSLKRLKQSSKIKNWSIKILINNCNKIYSQKKKRKEISYEVLYQNDATIEKYDFECTDDLEGLFKSLDTDERTIITLFYVQDYTSKDISKILNMNINTVKTKLLRAKEKIRNYINIDKKEEI